MFWQEEQLGFDQADELTADGAFVAAVARLGD